MKINIAVIVLLMILGGGSCRKSNSPASQSATFFKLYNVPVSKNAKTTRTTTTSSGSMATDVDGNIYVWYYDSVIAGHQRIAIIKTTKNGEEIWNKSYLPFFPINIDLDLNNNNLTWQDFFCIGQSLFIGGRDSVNNWEVLKINCSDGKLTNQFPVQLQPGFRSYFLLGSMWPTNSGNILLSANSGSSTGFQTPILSMMDLSGNILWTNYGFPSPVGDSTKYHEMPYCMLEPGNGNFIYGTIGMTNFSDSNGNSLISSTLYLRHINSSGVLISTDSLPQGTFNQSGKPTFINSNGAAQIFRVFTSSLGGYIVLSTEIYDSYQDCRVKILKTDASLRVQDSTYVSLGCSVVSSAVQNNDGDIIMSVFSQILPVPNVICNLYKIAPNGSVSAQGQVGLPNQSTFISGMCATTDNHFIMGGLIQFANIDTNNLFILKTDNNVHF